ncbi:MAG: Ig-like domain-containing protein [Acutalibacteraceae bacterium]|nr:Ig-like domain-containing protein [Acutalibacteraceae bacterium]
MLQQKIKGTVYPEGAIQTISFHSKNEGVATVSSDGTVTAKSSGTTDIVVSTANNILSKYTVIVKDSSTSILSTPTAKAVQTGVSTGGVLSWDEVENAEYYQIYTCDTANGNYTYSGSTTNTFYSIELESIHAKPANILSFFKIKAVTSNNNISDSELSDSIAYVYTGKSPYLSAELISEQGYGKGVLLHWSTIAASELYRTSSEDNKPVLIKTFYAGVGDSSYYDNKGELKEGVTYTYTLKPFNTYKGIKYYGVESTLTLEYQEDDPVVETCDEPHINAVTFQDNILYISTYNSPQHTLGRIYASDDNGETWFTTCNFFTGNTEYTYWSQDINLKPETTYLFKYKFYEHDYLFGLYRTASKYSNIVSVTTPKNPVTPQLSIKSNTGTSAELSWTGESIENGYYTVYRRNQGSGYWVAIATEIKSYQYTDTTADKNRFYYYKVVYTNPSPEFTVESNCNLTTVVRNLNSEDSNSVSFRTDKIIKDICTADFSEVKDRVYSDNMTLPEITVTYKGTKLQKMLTIL